MPTLPPAAVVEQQPDAVRAGDTLTITVRGHEDLTGDYVVNASGQVRFPRIGDVQAQQRDPAEIARDIEVGLSDGWLRDPQVTVSLLERAMMETVTVLGEVKEAGAYPHDGQLTFMKAISLAGGLTAVAQPHKVKLIRETAAGRKTVVIDLQEIVESRARDFPLAPGDTIVVPQSAI